MHEAMHPDPCVCQFGSNGCVGAETTSQMTLLGWPGQECTEHLCIAEQVNTALQGRNMPCVNKALLLGFYSFIFQYFVLFGGVSKRYLMYFSEDSPFLYNLKAALYLNE